MATSFVFDELELISLLFVTECTSLSSIPVRVTAAWLTVTEKLREASPAALEAADGLWLSHGRGSFHYIPGVTQ